MAKREVNHTRHPRPKLIIASLNNDESWHYIEVSGSPDKINEFKQFIHLNPYDQTDPLQWIVQNKPPANSVIYLPKSDITDTILDKPNLYCASVVTTKHDLLESGNLAKYAEAFSSLRITGLIKSRNELLSFLSASGIKRIFKTSYKLSSLNPGQPNYTELKSLLDSFSCELI